MAVPPTFVALVLALVASLSSTATTRADTRVAVLYFDNHTADPALDPLGKGLADMLITDLGALPGVTMVERARLEELLSEQRLQASKLSDPATAVKLGKLAGATYAVTGALTAVDPELRVDMRLIEIETARVVVAEKVVGKKASFFALEQALVSRFATALQAKMPAIAAASEGGIDAALAFAQGLDLADKGDLQAASKRLGDAVAKAPGFTLAQTRYADLLQRLYAARDKRAAALGGAAGALAQKVDEVVARDPKTLGGRELKRWFGYAILREHMLMKGIATTIGDPPGPFQSTLVSTAKQALVMPLVEAWLALMQRLRGAMVEARERGQTEAYTMTVFVLDDGDAKQAEELGLGMNAESIPFAEPQVILREIGGFLCAGETPFAAKVTVRMSPTPWELDARWQRTAIEAYDGALVEIDKFTRATIRQREAMRTYDAYGACLVARGRKVEGVMRWQTALERYPTAAEFGELEAKVRDALGH